MRELAEVDAVSQHFVQFTHEVSLGLTVWAANVELRCLLSSLLLGVALLQLDLAEFTEELVAISAFFWVVWEVFAHYATYFVDHFSLKLVLDLIHLDVELWYGLWAHNLLHGFV